MMSIPNYEDYKHEVLKSFYKNDFFNIEKYSNLILNRKYFKDDITYDIFAKTFLGIVELNKKNTEKADKYFDFVISKKINEEDIIIDDLWVYFLQGFSYIKSMEILNSTYIIENKDVFEKTLYDFLAKGFRYFPQNKKDFEDDLNYNLRENIIEKYFGIINNCYEILASILEIKETPFKPTKIKKNGKTINFGIFDTNLNKTIIYFGYKRTNFYGNSYEESLKNKETKDNILKIKNQFLSQKIEKNYENFSKNEEIKNLELFYKNYKEIENKIFYYDEEEFINKFDEIYELRKKGKYLDCLNIYKNLIKEFPNNFNILYSLSKTLILIGHFSLAKKICEREIMFEEMSGKNVFKKTMKDYLLDLNYGNFKRLQNKVADDTDFINFEPLSQMSRENFFFTNLDFSNEYEYINFLFFENKNKINIKTTEKINNDFSKNIKKSEEKYFETKKEDKNENFFGIGNGKIDREKYFKDKGIKIIGRKGYFLKFYISFILLIFIFIYSIIERVEGFDMLSLIIASSLWFFIGSKRVNDVF